MRLDDGAADGESHPHTISLGRVERLKNFVEPIFTYADAFVARPHSINAPSSVPPAP